VRPVVEGRVDGVLAQVFFNGAAVGNISAGSLAVMSDNISGKQGELTIIPASRRVDVGAGGGVTYAKTIELGESGLILDGRATV